MLWQISPSADADQTDGESEAVLSPKPQLFKKPFFSLRLKRVKSDRSLSTSSQESTADSKVQNTLSPSTPKKGSLLDVNMPRQRALTVGSARQKQALAPVVLQDLQRSPLMVKRSRQGEREATEGQFEVERSESPLAAGRHMLLRREDSSGTLGSRATNSPSVSSGDALQSDSASHSKLTPSDSPVERTHSRLSSRFQVYTPFDWDANDVASWLKHKLKMEQLGALFKEHSVDGEQLLALNSSKLKASEHPECLERVEPCPQVVVWLILLFLNILPFIPIP